MFFLYQVVYNGIFAVPSDGLSGNEEIDKLNNQLAEAYGAVSYYLQVRFDVTYSRFGEPEEVDEIEVQVNKCIKRHKDFMWRHQE